MDTTSTREAFLLRTYSRENAIEPCERAGKFFWTDIVEAANDERPGGTGRFFLVRGAGSNAAGNPPEGGDWTEGRTPREVVCQVTSAQTDFGIEVSSKLFEAAKDDGSFTGDIEADKIADGITGFWDYLDRLLSIGHGTGRLAIIAADSGPGTTITVGGDIDTPEGVFQLRDGQPIDIVDLDTGGTVQATTSIVDRDPRTHTIEVEDNVVVSAGWGIYQMGVYGNDIPVGNRAIVDDGDFASAYFTQSRSDNAYLNAVILDGNGGFQDYSEELVNDLLGLIGERSKYVPTELRCNQGIVEEHKRVVTGQRVFPTDGNSAVGGSLGMNHAKLAFTYGNVNVPFEIDRNYPARELYALWKPGYRKHTLRKPDWNKLGGSVFHPKIAVGGGTYAHAMVGNIMGDVAISHRRPNSQGALKKVRDRFSGRDS